jgi:endonuclease YncB( thermonuclease family)
MTRRARHVRHVTLAALVLATGFGGVPSDAASPPARPATAQVTPKAQPRPHGERVSVDPSRIEIDDGDTVVIRWSSDDAETVRILGIDTAETRHLEHDIPYAQPFGPEGRAFAEGAFAAARKVDLLRAATLDPYGRTLAYLFVDDLNYSVLVVRARLAYESVTFYGDNGFPEEAAAVLAAAKEAGPLPFEPPHLYRARMRDVTAWMKEHGTYPEK